MCEKADIELAAKIVERYNALVADTEEAKVDQLDQEIDDQAVELYGDEFKDYDTTIVPIELFHRMATEVVHHKTMLEGRGAGVVATFAGSSEGHNEYGISRDLKFEFKVALRVPDGQELTDDKIDEIVNCSFDAWRATLVKEADELKAQMKEIKARNEPN